MIGRSMRNMLMILILINVVILTSSTAGWYQLDDIEYYIDYTVAFGVGKAKEGCAARNATLANVKTQKIQDFLVTKIATLTEWPYSFYIGLRKKSSGSYWSDGTLTSYTNWEPGDDVYGPKKPCVTMGWDEGLDPAFKWKIVPCSSHHRYICQRRILTTSTTVESATTHSTTLGKHIIAIPTTDTTTEQYTSDVNSTLTSQTETDTRISSDGFYKTPLWVIPVVAVLAGTVFILAAVIIYLLGRLRLNKTTGPDIANPSNNTIEPEYSITPYATTTNSHPEYENTRVQQSPYEVLNGGK